MEDYYEVWPLTGNQVTKSFPVDHEFIVSDDICFMLYVNHYVYIPEFPEVELLQTEYKEASRSDKHNLARVGTQSGFT